MYDCVRVYVVCLAFVYMSYVKNVEYMIIFKIQGCKSCVGDASGD